MMLDLVEDRLLPVLIFLSITFDVIALCAGGWLQGYYGDVIVLQLSPWRLCRLDCLSCGDGVKPTFGCFGMHDWTDTDFGENSRAGDTSFRVTCLKLFLFIQF